MQFHKFVLACTDVPLNRRQGQYAVNQLQMIRPDLAQRYYNEIMILGDNSEVVKDADPYYVDANLDRFFMWLATVWTTTS